LTDRRGGEWGEGHLSELQSMRLAVPGSSSDAVDGGGGSSGTARLGRGQHGHRDQRPVAWAGPGWQTGQVRGATLRNKVATA
jgi:hypothetical protein